MSRVLRRSKTKEKVSAQYGVADPDPADLDIRQTRHRQYSAAPPVTGGTWRDRVTTRERSESPIFISTTPDAMSTDEAIEMSQCILKDQICPCTVYGKISLYFSIILQP